VATPPITVHGTERVRWTQTAADARQVMRYTYVAYIDGRQRPLPDAACQGTKVATQFDCSAKLPSMSLGAHRLELATAVVANGVRLESTKSPPINVLMVGDKSHVDEPRADSHAT
jgi:hypothetical protein